jgi:predicted dehydrogenase
LGDAVKLRKLGRKYGIDHLHGYEEHERALESEADAVYIALPNDLHREYAERAANMGVHVLCEKPVAPSVPNCEAMIEAAQRIRMPITTSITTSW